MKKGDSGIRGEADPRIRRCRLSKKAQEAVRNAHERDCPTCIRLLDGRHRKAMSFLRRHEEPQPPAISACGDVRVSDDCQPSRTCQPGPKTSACSHICTNASVAKLRCASSYCL